MQEKIKNKIKKLPDEPGVYFFKKGGKILYIGKATSLKDRVRSYFSGNMMEARGPLIHQMLEDFDDIKFQKTDSVLEALILEAKLIRQHLPPANVLGKDDKSFNYVVITKEDWPRVLVMRGKELEAAKTNSEAVITEGNSAKTANASAAKEFVFAAGTKTFGPFTHGRQLKEAMKIVRRMFPWRGNKCEPEQVRPCFERQINLCPGVCTGDISKKEYAKQIKKIILFFEGDKKKLIKSLEKEMKQLAKSREFEKAEKAKRQIYTLYHIQDVSLIKQDRIDPVVNFGTAQSAGKNSYAKIHYRIESYDIAHLSETNRVGVMTVVEDGEVKKSDYRKFKIQTREMGDVAALSEVLKRRLRHSEWPLPNLIVVDGGVQQKNVMEKVLIERSLDIPVVAVVKDERHKPREIMGLNHELRIMDYGEEKKNKEYGIKNMEKQILLANAEAHRFALAFHRRRRGKLI